MFFAGIWREWEGDRGTKTVPDKTWSASHGCVLTDHRPVSTNSPLPASSTAAPSSGCSTKPSPAEATPLRTGGPASSLDVLEVLAAA